MGDIPVQLSPLTVDEEQLTRTVHYTHDGKSITFEIVNKLGTQAESNSSTKEAGPTPDSIFKTISRELNILLLHFSKTGSQRL